MEKQKMKIVGLLGAIIFLLLAPSFLDSYWIRVITGIFLFAIMAEALNIIVGYCGYPAFGNIVFFGIGAYTTGVLMNKVAAPFIPSMIAGGVLSALYAAVLGLPILRLKGHYFAVCTLGVSEATREIVDNMVSLTGGGQGMTVPLIPKPIEWINLYFYYLTLGILGVTILVVFLISRSRLGYTLRAIRGDEDAALTMGINTTRYKIIAWSISAFFTALAGGIYAYWFTHIETTTVFALFIGIKFWIMYLLGGGGTVFGPVIGAFLLEFLSEWVWGKFLFIHTAVLGGIVVLVIIFMPQGFMKLVRQRLSFATLMANIRENRVT